MSQYILTVSPMHISDLSQGRDGVWGVVPRHFLFFKIGEKFDVDKCVSEFVNSFKTIMAATSTEAQQTYNEAFERWGNDLLHGLEAKMAEFNPDLRAYSNDIANYQRQIDELRKQ